MPTIRISDVVKNNKKIKDMLDNLDRIEVDVEFKYNEESLAELDRKFSLFLRSMGKEISASMYEVITGAYSKYGFYPREDETIRKYLRMGYDFSDDGMVLTGNIARILSKVKEKDFGGTSLTVKGKMNSSGVVSVISDTSNRFFNYMNVVERKKTINNVNLEYEDLSLSGTVKFSLISPYMSRWDSDITRPRPIRLTTISFFLTGLKRRIKKFFK